MTSHAKPLFSKLARQVIFVQHEWAKYPEERHAELTDVLALVSDLDGEGIASCILGTRALQFYRAKRVTDVRKIILLLEKWSHANHLPFGILVVQDWQICVPMAKFKRALSILIDGGGKQKCGSPDRPETSAPSSVIGCFECVPRSRTSFSPSERPLERCPQLKLHGVLLFVDLLPDGLWYFDCMRNAHRDSTSAISATHRGLPYPALLPFVQSLLDRANEVDLVDLVDGLNLPIEWADEAVHIDSVAASAASTGHRRCMTGSRPSSSIPPPQNALYGTLLSTASRRVWAISILPTSG
jgi:hypothetical protein